LGEGGAEEPGHLHLGDADPGADLALRELFAEAKGE
jgi:hypothetical protein